MKKVKQGTILDRIINHQRVCLQQEEEDKIHCLTLRTAYQRNRKQDIEHLKHDIRVKREKIRGCIKEQQ